MMTTETTTFTMKRGKEKSISTCMRADGINSRKSDRIQAGSGAVCMSVAVKVKHQGKSSNHADGEEWVIHRAVSAKGC